MKLQKKSIVGIVLINFVLNFIVQSLDEGRGFSWLKELNSYYEFFIHVFITSFISFLIYLSIRKYGEKKAVIISSFMGVPVLIIIFIVIVQFLSK